MSKLAYRTIGNEHPQGKPKVYFACHPDDQTSFLEDYALKILHIQTCAIWYETEYTADYDREELEAQLSEMQLIVMPVTTKLLTKPNRAMDVELAIARERHIPVLPIMLEGGLTDVFTKRFGSLQYIDPNDEDPTRRSFDEVLETYIKAMLIGDEMAKKVRAAFDAYIFLSYRKKDRAKAQKLMRLIHKSPLCQDIAIWYDEFLTPGEDFNDLIEAMLKKSDLFALAVTPNLVNEINYVMTTEYPAARRSGKAVLSVEMEETDREKLQESYEGIPDPIASDDEERLLAALQKMLYTVAISENDSDPEHCFLIGLAYLDGIDVEVDFERAVRLIRFAAEAGVPEAMEQLVIMYETGKGIARDYREGVEWRRKHAAYLGKRIKEEPNGKIAKSFFSELKNLGNALFDIRHFEEAKEVYQEMLRFAKRYERSGPEFKRWITIGYDKLGRIAKAEGRLDEARSWYSKCLEIDLALIEGTGTVLSRRDLSISYISLGDMAKAQGKLEEAKEYYEKGLEIRLALARETGTVLSRRELVVSYDKLGDIAEAQGRLEEAKEYYEKGLEIRLALAKETGTLEAFEDLQIICFNFGAFLYNTNTDIGKAKEMFRKVIQIGEESGYLQLRKRTDDAKTILSRFF